MLLSFMSRRPSNKIRSSSFSLKGGLNLVDTPLSIAPGMALATLNYELLSRDGYRRIDGFERYDGQQKPTDSSYWILNYDGGTSLVTEGDTIVGLTSGASSEVLSVWGDAVSGYLVIAEISGTFLDNETFKVGSTNKANVNGVAEARGAATPAEDATYSQDAIETQRAKILTVGDAACTGKVRGVHVYNGVTYAFRDKADLTECLMFKSSSAGWVQVSLGNRVAFTAGTSAFAEGETLTGGTSLATSTINRVVVQSGAWGTSDAAGYLVIGTVTGGPYQAEAGTSASGSATLSGAEVANQLKQGGKFEFENYNFFGSSGTFRMYGVDGVSTAFEFDGTTFVPILTGNTVDTPTHLAVNEYHLMLCFANGSLQNSGTGNPYDWGGISGGGAAEIGTGDELIGLKKEIGGSLAVICRNRTFALQGKNTLGSPWDLRTLSDEAGGIEWSLQRIGSTFYIDDRGFTRVDAVQAYGDFSTSVFSQVIEPLILDKKNNIISSIIVKSKSQYRVFFDDGTGIIATFNGKKISGFTLLRYVDKNSAAVIANCTANGEDSSGNEVLFFGDNNGYVHQMDQGTSFDGGEVSATIALTYNNIGSPSMDKQFKKVVIETDGAAGVNLNYNALLDYSSGRSPTGITLTGALAAGGATWNAIIWNAFNWTSEDVSQIEGNIDGVGRNISLQLSSTGTYTEPHTLYSVTYHYITRKLVR